MNKEDEPPVKKSWLQLLARGIATAAFVGLAIYLATPVVKPEPDLQQVGDGVIVAYESILIDDKPVDASMQAGVTSQYNRSTGLMTVSIKVPYAERVWLGLKSTGRDWKCFLRPAVNSVTEDGKPVAFRSTSADAVPKALERFSWGPRHWFDKAGEIDSLSGHLLEGFPPRVSSTFASTTWHAATSAEFTGKKPTYSSSVTCAAESGDRRKSTATSIPAVNVVDLVGGKSALSQYKCKNMLTVTRGGGDEIVDSTIFHGPITPYGLLTMDEATPVVNGQLWKLEGECDAQPIDLNPSFVYAYHSVGVSLLIPNRQAQSQLQARSVIAGAALGVVGQIVFEWLRLGATRLTENNRRLVRRKRLDKETEEED